MAKKNDRYTYRITWSEEDQEYVGSCTEFPSLSWLTRTPEAALKGIRKVVAGVIRDMKRNNEPIPEPIATKDTAANLWSAFHLMFIVIWLSRRPRPG